MNMRQIEIFQMVMEKGTTSAAAAALNISQPAVSNMVRHIESQIGFDLFKRDKGRLQPTKEAKALYKEAEHMFLIFRSVQQKILDLKNATTGTIRIVAGPSAGHSVVPAALGSFLETRPEVKVSVDIRRTETAAEHVFHGLADIGLTTVALEHPGVQFEPIHMGVMVCVMPPSHPLTQKRVIRPGDLVGHRFVMLERGSPVGRLVMGAFTSAGVDYDWPIETTYMNTACALAKGVDGVTVIDQYTAQALHADELVIRPFLPTIHLSVYILTSTQHAVSNLANIFVEHVEMLYFKNLPKIRA